MYSPHRMPCTTLIKSVIAGTPISIGSIRSRFNRPGYVYVMSGVYIEFTIWFSFMLIGVSYVCYFFSKEVSQRVMYRLTLHVECLFSAPVRKFGVSDSCV